MFSEKPITLLTTKEVAERLKVSPYAVFQLVRQGKLPAITNLGKSFKFALSDVEKYLRSQGVGVTQ